MNRFFRIDILIDEVRKRRELWDSDHADHMNKAKKRQSWREICQAVDACFEKLSKEKYLFIRQMQNKWKGLRNSYNRELKLRAQVTARPVVSRKPYIYFDQLNFLEPYISKNKRRQLPAIKTEESSEEEIIQFVIEDAVIEIVDEEPKNSHSEDKSNTAATKVQDCQPRNIEGCKVMIAKDAKGNLNFSRMQPINNDSSKALNEHEYNKTKGDNLDSTQRLGAQRLNSQQTQTNFGKQENLQSKLGNISVVCVKPKVVNGQIQIDNVPKSQVCVIAKQIDKPTEQSNYYKQPQLNNLPIGKDVSVTYASKNISPIKRRILEHSDNNSSKKSSLPQKPNHENETNEVSSTSTLILEKSANESDRLKPEAPKSGGLCFISSALSNHGTAFISNHPNHLVRKSSSLGTKRPTYNDSKCDNSVENGKNSSGYKPNASILNSNREEVDRNYSNTSKNNVHSSISMLKCNNSVEEDKNNSNISSNNANYLYFGGTSAGEDRNYTNRYSTSNASVGGRNKLSSIENTSNLQCDSFLEEDGNYSHNAAISPALSQTSLEEDRVYANTSKNIQISSNSKRVSTLEDGRLNKSNNITPQNRSNHTANTSIPKCATSIENGSNNASITKSDNSLEDDKMFLMSLLNEFNAVPTKYKFDVKIEFLKAIRNYSKKE